MRELKLHGKSDHIALVDDDDFEMLSAYRWYPLKAARSLTVYARTNIDGRHVFMHRLLMGKKCAGLDVDHEDGNGLNNQRANLRPMTHRNNVIYGQARLAYDAWKASRSAPRL